jgi:transcription initiation factor IIF auxiliary subunit
MIQQEGWGEFDLRVILHFRDGSLPQTILFDVNFNRNKYSAFHKLVNTTILDIDYIYSIFSL